MRKIAFVLSIFCSISALAQNLGSVLQTQSISGTGYLSPRIQFRYSSQRFNPPLIFDIGGTTATENIMQVVPLTTANTTTFRVTPMAQATALVYPDPGGATGTFPFLEAAQTWTAGNTFTSAVTVSPTTNQIKFGAAGHLVTVSYTAPAAAAQTYTVPDAGGNATYMFTNSTNVQNLISNAFKIADNTDNTKLIAFSAASITTGTTRTITAPDANITLNGIVEQSCGVAAGGSAAACSSSNVSSTVKEVFGTVALVSGTPSQVTLTALPAFGGTNTYACTCTPQGNTAAIAAGGCAATNVSSSSVTLTGPNTVSTVVFYDCKGT